MKVVSLFSGGGGLDLGFKSEGYEIVWAIDNNMSAVKTYEYNISKHIICEDINLINIQNIPKADVIIGGPPCQAFSLTGMRNANDPRAKLVWKYFEILESIKPKAFVFENVTGLLSAKDNRGKKVLPQLISSFQKLGYKVNASVMNAVDYGVPQKRKRVIVVGILGNAEFLSIAPTHNIDGSNGLFKYVSVEDAIGDLPEASKEDKVLNYAFTAKNDYQRKMQSKHGITDHTIPKMSELDVFICKHVKPGGNYMDIPKSVKSKRIRRLQKDGGHTTCYGRMSANSPSYTINTYFNRPNVGCNIHYKFDRLITVREALRLQSFTDDYKIVSLNKKDKHLIVGNAVPPLLSQVIARELKKYLE